MDSGSIAFFASGRLIVTYAMRSRFSYNTLGIASLAGEPKTLAPLASKWAACRARRDAEETGTSRDGSGGHCGGLRHGRVRGARCSGGSPRGPFQRGEGRRQHWAGRSLRSGGCWARTTAVLAQEGRGGRAELRTPPGEFAARRASRLALRAAEPARALARARLRTAGGHAAERGRGTSPMAPRSDLGVFKADDDERGHAFGDALRGTPPRRGAPSCARGTCSARYGGEESWCRCPDAARATARDVDRLRGAIPDGQTASAGLAAWRRSETGKD